MHFIQKSKCLVPFFGKSQIDKHTAVIFSLQLLLRHTHLGIGIAERF